MRRILIRSLVISLAFNLGILLAVRYEAAPDICRFLVAPGFIAAWLIPVGEVGKFLLFFGINWLLWSAIWMYILWLLKYLLRPADRS